MSSRRLEVINGHLEPHPVSSLNHVPSQRYRYTLDGSNILSEKDRQFFEENGYFVVRKLISEEQVEKYKDRFQLVCDKKLTIPGLTVMKDVALTSPDVAVSERSVNKIQTFQNDPVLFGYCEEKQILKYVEAFVGKDIMAMHTMLINKPPDPGTKTSRHPMHQDLHYFPFRPADRIVASWTAMQRITRENGCLVVLPGTHRLPGKLLKHDYPEWEGGVNKMYHGIHDFDPSAPRVYLEMDSGDTVFFHPLLIHGSGANTSTNFRKAISCHYASSFCDYIDVKGTLQENIGKEVEEIAQRKLGDDVQVDFRDIWTFKGRCVQGNRVNL